MLRSMTAYGRESTRIAGTEIVCEFRSVNHRYLDVVLRLPEPLRVLEAKLRERLVTHLSRGKVEVTLKLVESDDSSKPLVLNQVLLSTLLDASHNIAELTDKNTVIDTVRLMQWPGVMNTHEHSLSDLSDAATAVFDAALTDFVQTREREGQQIRDLLCAKTSQLAEQVAQLRMIRPDVLSRQRERWLNKLSQLQAEPDQSRLEQELVYAAQRLDIDEELDRLDAHCIEIGNAVQRTEPVGRRLDFLMQECNREANTISSKSNDVNTTSGSVEMKVIIEQMREQVQNIE